MGRREFLVFFAGGEYGILKGEGSWLKTFVRVGITMFDEKKRRWMTERVVMGTGKNPGKMEIRGGGKILIGDVKGKYDIDSVVIGLSNPKEITAAYPITRNHPFKDTDIIELHNGKQVILRNMHSVYKDDRHRNYYMILFNDGSVLHTSGISDKRIFKQAA